MQPLIKAFLFLCSLAIAQMAIAQAPLTKPASGQCVKQFWASVTMPDGKIAKIKMNEGEMATITLFKEGRGIGITPFTSTRKGADVGLRIANLVIGVDQQEIATHAATVYVAEQGEATYEHQGMGFKIQMLPTEHYADPVAPCGGTAGLTRCCVTCGSTTVCGEEVQHDCGSCCNNCLIGGAG
jgi:hypothetical protein